MPVLGYCRLCRLERHLQLSHYLPRAAYSANRARELKNQNPVLLTPERGMRQEQSQIKDFALCAVCEDLFNRRGESWMLARIPRGYREPFLLQDVLVRETPLHSGPGIDLYAAEKIAELDVEQIVYFATSIFWRGAAHEWTLNGEIVTKIDLQGHEESLHMFLRGLAEFPNDVWLSVIMWPFKPVLNLALAPMPNSFEPGWHRYWFYFFGFGFVLHFGDSVPPGIKRTCAQHSHEKVISVERGLGQNVLDFLRCIAKQNQTEQSLAMFAEIEKVRANNA